MTTTTIRKLIAVVAGLAAAVTVCGLLYGNPTAIGLGVAVVAACYLARELVLAVEDGRWAEDKARHPAWHRTGQCGDICVGCEFHPETICGEDCSGCCNEAELWS